MHRFQDTLNLRIKKNAFIIGNKTGLTLGDYTLDNIHSTIVPSAEPTLYGTVFPFDYHDIAEYMILSILVLQTFGFFSTVFVKGRSLQSLWAMANTMTFIAHTSLLEIKSIPGQVYSA